MERSVLIFFGALLFVALGSSLADELRDGVNGGRHHLRSSRPANETGLCYKRLPYAEALKLNTTGHVHEVHLGKGVKTQTHYNSNSGWMTVIDCCEGYIRDLITDKCVVYCEGGCSGGICVPGGICTCDSGWNPENGVCKPVCRRACPTNTYCMGPELCVCKYGWEQNVDGSCRPICPGGCGNGECVDYQVCRCRRGNVLNDNNKCQSICEGGCPHGECTSPGVCTCYSGYANPRGDTESCLPDCGLNDCGPGGDCTSPGVCTCRPGYQRDYTTGSCKPKCQTACPENGHCVAPNRCDCEHGFNLDRDGRRCIAVYSSGSSEGHSGVESASQTGREWGTQAGSRQDGQWGSHSGSQPGSQWEGHSGTQQGGNSGSQQGGQWGGQSGGQIDRPWGSHSGTQQGGNSGSQQGGQWGGQSGGQSRDHCDRPCINGQCTGWNVCTCNNGYVLDARDPSRCIPRCPHGCPNGVCSGPNLCLCKAGYVKDRSVKGSQRCIPQPY